MSSTPATSTPTPPASPARSTAICTPPRGPARARLEKPAPGAPGLSRLLSPRQLAADTRYHACVVPVFMAGRIAGLGGRPDPTAAAGPAWDVSASGEAELTL